MLLIRTSEACGLEHSQHELDSKSNQFAAPGRQRSADQIRHRTGPRIVAVEIDKKDWRDREL